MSDRQDDVARDGDRGTRIAAFARLEGRAFLKSGGFVYPQTINRKCAGCDHAFNDLNMPVANGMLCAWCTTILKAAWENRPQRLLTGRMCRVLVYDPGELEDSPSLTEVRLFDEARRLKKPEPQPHPSKYPCTQCGATIQPGDFAAFTEHDMLCRKCFLKEMPELQSVVDAWDRLQAKREDLAAKHGAALAAAWANSNG